MDKIVWITGAGSGIGAALAQAFAQAGYRMALTGRGVEALERVASGFPGRTDTLIVPCDVTDREGIFAAAAQIAAWGGGIHILCNNAGLNIPRRSWAELDWESWDTLLRVNITGALNVIGACLPVMRAQKDGIMIHTSSWAGRFHSPGGGVAYGASKHALSDISASLNAQEGVHGIRSTALCPAEVATPLLARKPGFDPATLGDMIQPEDMARTALYVAQMNPAVAVHEVLLAPVRR
jgi:NADP-dependent 3-hydroxy acid dehydrogenase YdfG